MKINRIEIENVKRIKAVKVEPKANGLTIIGGNNNQGKTSISDSIAWALGGEHYKPSQATREDSVIPPNLHIVMNNGLVAGEKGQTYCITHSNSLSNKMYNSLLVVRDINHKYIVVEETRDKKTKILDEAELPLPELSVKDGELIGVNVVLTAHAQSRKFEQSVEPWCICIGK